MEKTKICTKCGIEKTLENFVKQKSGKYNVTAKCKNCYKKYYEKYISKSENKKKRHENYVKRYNKLEIRKRISEQGKEYRKQEYVKKAQIKKEMRMREKYPEKRFARNEMTKAICRGDLKRKPCIMCGNSKSEGHHEDYNKPLDVIWLCKKHHTELHRKRGFKNE